MFVWVRRNLVWILPTLLLLGTLFGWHLYRTYFVNEPLLSAAAEGKDEWVRTLLSKGADINVQEENNQTTPLMYAVSRGHLSTAQLLLTHGANVHLKNSQGWTALMFARKNPPMIALLKEAGASQ